MASFFPEKNDRKLFAVLVNNKLLKLENSEAISDALTALEVRVLIHIIQQPYCLILLNKICRMHFGLVGKIVVTRGCSSFVTTTGCTTSDSKMGSTTTCYCSTDMCNAASSILPYSSFVLASLLVVALANAVESYWL